MASNNTILHRGYVERIQPNTKRVIDNIKLNEVSLLFTDGLIGKENPGTVQREGENTIYQINSLGFRGKEFTGKFGILGDSFVFGVGVDDCFAEQLDHDNLGVPATSNDAMVRRAMQYINKYPSCKRLIVVWTYGYRKEWVTEECKPYEFKLKATIRSTKKDYYNLIDRAFADLSNDYFDYYGWYKNQMLLQLFCESHNVELFEFNNHSVPFIDNDFGADGKHPGQQWHNAMYKHISETVNA